MLPCTVKGSFEEQRLLVLSNAGGWGGVNRQIAERESEDLRFGRQYPGFIIVQILFNNTDKFFYCRIFLRVSRVLQSNGQNMQTIQLTLRIRMMVKE